MKKKILSIILSAMVLMGTVAFSACGNGDKLAELEETIVELEETIVELEETIDQREATIKNLAKGQVLRLKMAYDIGLITKDDLLSIAYYCNGGNSGNEEVMPDDFIPQPIGQLTTEIENSIIEEVLKERIKSGIYVEDPGEINYCGTYNNCVAFLNIFDGMDAESWLKVENIKFYGPTRHSTVYIWVNPQSIVK